MPERSMQLAWLATVGLITWASLSPPGSQGGPAQPDQWLMNLGHVPAYAFLTAVTLRLARMRIASRGRVALAAAAFGLAVGALFEALQPLVGRDGNLTDMTLNALGVALTITMWNHGWPRKLQRILRSDST